MTDSDEWPAYQIDSHDHMHAIGVLIAGGNERCLLALKDHLWPSPKGRAVEIDLGEVSDAATALSGIAKIIKAMGAGEVTPDEAATLTSPLEKYLRTTEIAELERRVTALENAP
jgi:hypothetical protein